MQAPCRCKRIRGLIRLSALLPLSPSQELQADPIIVDHQISIASAPNSARFEFPHLLCHDAHIGGAIPTLVAEAIEFESVIKPHQRHDVFFETEVGTVSTATATSAMSASMTHVMAATTTTHMVPAPAAAVMAHVTTAARMVTNVTTATLMVTNVMPALVLFTAMVFDVVSPVPVPMPIVPSVAAAPPEA